MQCTNKHCLLGYEFYVSTTLSFEHLHHGVIVVIKRGDTNELLAQPVTIETPSAFKSIRAAEIEASAYAHELILRGAMLEILGPSSSCKADASADDSRVRNLTSNQGV